MAPAAAPSSAFERLRAWLAGGRGHALGALGVRVAAAGLAYLLQIVLARLLGAGDYGTFSLTWNVLTIGGFLATLGFSELAVRFLAQYHERGDFARASGFLRLGLMVSLAGALLAALLGVVLTPFMREAYGELSAQLLRIGLVALPFFSLTDYLEGVARSQGWTIRALAPPYVLRHALVITLALGLALWHPPVSAPLAMVATVAATAFAALAQVMLIAPHLRMALPAARVPVYEVALWREAAAPTLLSELATLARLNIDLLVLGLFVPATAVGFYFAATRLASLLGLIEFAVRAGMGHRFARAAQSDDPGALQQVYAQARTMALWPGLAAALALMLASPWILALFGQGFAEAAPLAALLLGANALRLIFGPSDEALAMAGHPGCVWRGNALCALVAGLGTAVLAPAFGALGAALATFGGTLAGGVLMLVYLKRRLNLSPFARKGAA